jgi:hypothetical protein
MTSNGMTWEGFGSGRFITEEIPVGWATRAGLDTTTKNKMTVPLPGIEGRSSSL